MTEIAGALISIVLVLLAVFLPVAFLGGVTGTLYKQFAITIAISMVISGIMALTLSPALAAIIIKAHHGEKNRFFRAFDSGFEWLRRGTSAASRASIQVWPITLIAFGGVIAGILLLFRVLPASFVPEEDQGYFFVVGQVPDAASLGVTGRFSKALEEIILKDPAVQDVGTVNGYSFVDGQQNNSAAVMFGLLKPFDERKDPYAALFDTLKRLNAQFFGAQGRIRVRRQPAVDSRDWARPAGSSSTSRIAARAIRAPPIRRCRRSSPRRAQRPELQGVNTTFRALEPAALRRSRSQQGRGARRARCGDVFQAMQAYFGSQVAGQFSQFSRVWFVILQADADYRAEPEDFSKVYVRVGERRQRPALGADHDALRRVAEAGDAVQRLPLGEDHRQPGAGLQLGPGASARWKRSRARRCRAISRIAWAGQALQEKESGSTSSSAFIFGLIVVFLLLAAQFEKWTLPVAVVLTVPFAVLGALGLTWVLGLENDVYFQVGLVTLVGLAAKNAILICEFAIERVRHGMAVREAAIEAAGLRLRAIVMTSFAFILGCVPLADRDRPGRQQPARHRHRRDRRHARLDADRDLLRAVVLLAARVDEREVRREEGAHSRRRARRGAGPARMRSGRRSK